MLVFDADFQKKTCPKIILIWILGKKDRAFLGYRNEDMLKIFKGKNDITRLLN